MTNTFNTGRAMLDAMGEHRCTGKAFIPADQPRNLMLGYVCAVCNEIFEVPHGHATIGLTSDETKDMGTSEGRITLAVVAEGQSAPLRVRFSSGTEMFNAILAHRCDEHQKFYQHDNPRALTVGFECGTCRMIFEAHYQQVSEDLNESEKVAMQTVEGRLLLSECLSAGHRITLSELNQLQDR